MKRARIITATKLRLYLSASLLLVVLVAIAALYFANDKLQTYATEVSQATAQAQESQNNIQSLQRIQQELADNKSVIERTRDIVADSKSYQYQDQIIKDLNDYAKQSGITITNMDFSAASATTPTTLAPSAPTGVKSTSVSVALKNPVNYTNLLRFVRSIEQNLTKMQISRINLSKNENNQVTSEVLTIEVYIR
jgi:TolA-binding protein